MIHPLNVRNYHSKGKQTKKKEDDYDKLIQGLMIQKYLALSTMDYMDEESDSLDSKETKAKLELSKKVKRKSLNPQMKLILLKKEEFKSNSATN